MLTRAGRQTSTPSRKRCWRFSGRERAPWPVAAGSATRRMAMQGKEDGSDMMVAHVMEHRLQRGRGVLRMMVWRGSGKRRQPWNRSSCRQSVPWLSRIRPGGMLVLVLVFVLVFVDVFWRQRRYMHHGVGVGAGWTSTRGHDGRAVATSRPPRPTTVADNASACAHADTSRATVASSSCSCTLTVH